LDGHENCGEVIKGSNCVRQIAGFGNYVRRCRWIDDVLGHLLHDEVTDDQVHEVVGHGNLVIEAELLVPVERDVGSGLVGTHEWRVSIVDGHASAPGDAVGGRVLLGSNLSAVGVKRVREQHWVDSIVGLVGVQEVHTEVAAGLGRVLDNN